MELCIGFLNQGDPKQILVLTAGEEGISMAIAILDARNLVINYDEEGGTHLDESEDIEPVVCESLEVVCLEAVNTSKLDRLRGYHAEGIQKPLVF